MRHKFHAQGKQGTASTEFTQNSIQWTNQAFSSWDIDTSIDECLVLKVNGLMNEWIKEWNIVLAKVNISNHKDYILCR